MLGRYDRRCFAYFVLWLTGEWANSDSDVYRYLSDNSDGKLTTELQCEWGFYNKDRNERYSRKQINGACKLFRCLFDTLYETFPTDAGNGLQTTMSQCVLIRVTRKEKIFLFDAGPSSEYVIADSVEAALEQLSEYHDLDSDERDGGWYSLKHVLVDITRAAS
jgi:hypothetical protein